MESLAALTLLAAAVVYGPQQQSSTARAGWPCNAPLDLSYFRVAEGSGGHLLLLAPEEIGDSAALLTAFGSHQETILRLAGSLNPGLHEFHVPIDRSVESVVFSMSVQCLQVADVCGPSGAAPGGDNVSDLSNFRAMRVVIVERPEPGTWTIRLSGSGISGVVVQARSTIGIADVQFAAAPSGTFKPIPSPGAENAIRIRMRGNASDVTASLVSGVLVPIAPLPLEQSETDGSYTSRFTPAAEGFRVLVAGKDSEGGAFQRMDPRLITPR